ncbi:uncharacterized protein LOC136080532 [Hydra vulgaris]|uniref:Uncharacterized protein LOC136080532 n=1 Tax=Hydra vulgaris TaxID=6087 RepID=A0ABM4BW13_HYDVU
MVNCVMCQKSFRLKVGKDQNTRCEKCASQWRDYQLIEQRLEAEKKKEEDKIRMKELLLREKQLELEKLKITIKESQGNGNAIELTCYYDQNAQKKVSELLAGARSTSPHTPLPSLPTASLFRKKPTGCVRNATEFLDYRKPRKLPSIEGLRNRVALRHKLEEDYRSSAGSSGISVD